MFGFTDDGERQYSVHRCTPSRFCNCHPMERWSHRWVRNCGAWPDGASRRPRTSRPSYPRRSTCCAGLRRVPRRRCFLTTTSNCSIRCGRPRIAGRRRRSSSRDRGLCHGVDQTGLGLFRRLPARSVRRHRTSGGRSLALAVVLADIDPAPRQEADRDHRQGDAGGFPFLAPRERCRSGHDRPPCQAPRVTSRCPILHLPS